MNKLTKKLLSGVAKVSESIVNPEDMVEEFDKCWVWSYMPPKPASMQNTAEYADLIESK